MTRKNLFTLAICFLLAFSFFTVPGEAESKPIVLKCAAMGPNSMPVMAGFEVWGKEIEKRTNGRVKFQFFWGASLLKAGTELKGTGAGLADVSIDVAAYHPSDTPFSTIGQLGFITSQVDAPARALADLYESLPYFKAEYDRHNVKVMTFVPFPPTIMGFVKPVKKLEDLKGRKIRALGLLNEVVAALGGTPLGIKVPELYESLNRKVIDGFTGIMISGIMGFKIHEVAKYYVDFGFGNYLVETIIINKDKWNSLPEDIRNIIEEVNKKGVDIYTDLYARTEPDYVKPLQSAGCDFYTLPPDEAARWKNLIIPGMWNDWVAKHKKYGPAQEFFDKYLERVKYHEPSSTYSNPFPK